MVSQVLTNGRHFFKKEPEVSIRSFGLAGEEMERWFKDGVVCVISSVGLEMPLAMRQKLKSIQSSWYCGYVIFKKPFLKSDGFRGFVSYVPVHGGITFCRQNSEGNICYGFDCGHVGDESPESPTRQTGWLKAECEKMALALHEAKRFEKGYLRAKKNSTKAEYIDKYHKYLSEEFANQFDLSNNFGVMFNLLLGEL